MKFLDFWLSALYPLVPGLFPWG